MSYGEATVDLVADLTGRGIDHAVLLMRHSAREFHPDRHDLENPLTDEGRTLARALGTRLPKHMTLRGYASPPERCMETAQLVLDAHRDAGGAVTRHRPLEALGVFYALDQMKMWKGMKLAGGLVPYLERWFQGEVPSDAMMAPDLAARLVLHVLADKLAAPVASQQLDLCVSHDMTLYLLRAQLLGEPVDGPEVAFLDALALYSEDGALWMQSHHGAPRRVSELL
ncbi:MAG: histidine phosphatase family protein [Pseudomonadales bacterium]